MACLTGAEVKRSLQNKADIYNWIQGANALLCYYEVREGRDVCVSPGAYVSQ